jgi:hypothetical protein
MFESISYRDPMQDVYGIGIGHFAETTQTFSLFRSKDFSETNNDCYFLMLKPIKVCYKKVW